MSYDWLLRIPASLRLHRLIKTILAELTFPQSCAPGHFYSPIPARAEIFRDTNRIFATGCDALPEIDLQESNQLELLQRLSRKVAGYKWDQIGARFRIQNEYLPLADAILLVGILLEMQPRRYVEIGSGHSSALVLDVRDRFLEGKVHCTFIEPNSDRLESLLCARDNQSDLIVKTRVQDVEDELFLGLEKEDVLFVDGSHVAKVGSDLNDVLFRVLPLLRPGVLIHFHDILWPFEYRREDVLRGRSWNEAYLLRAFLAGNSLYRIYLFGSWLEQCYPEQWYVNFPQAMGSSASSLWIRKMSVGETAK